MVEGEVPARVRGVWERLAGAEFPDAGETRVVVSPGSRLCPPSWTGAVRIGDAVLIIVPSARVARRLPLDFDTLRSAPEVLGPAILSYLPHATTPPTTATPHGDLRTLLSAASPRDIAESCITDVDSPLFAVHDGPRVLAAAGYATWPASTAHLCVLTAPAARGRGLAGEVALVAVEHALRAGLLPQWRARLQASRRVAVKLGFREVGEQVSARLGEG
ncbi:GNAT family N-acetyltransferase [Streptomyces roseirectus]|uniref:GNAT family N-acetyltransferase n=1 Tax=Streptomyces roseirectus TaxID=2768066 RepID=A0A7H0IP72_9ACTN|nr:GNAT family N-acetyltransferase [Streptomyces roseirectus]QNP74588.1 GNAT family N-acetyltransferase [Streptomyces roseirectus]